METKQFRYQLINMQIFTYRPYSGITYNTSNSLTSLLHNRFYFLDPFKQKWHSAVTESPKCFNYKLFKTDHTYEHFLDILPSAYLQKMINFVCVITIYPQKNYVGLVLTEIIESVTHVIKEILETIFIIQLFVFR